MRRVHLDHFKFLDKNSLSASRRMFNYQCLMRLIYRTHRMNLSIRDSAVKNFVEFQSELNLLAQLWSRCRIVGGGGRTKVCGGHLENIKNSLKNWHTSKLLHWTHRDLSLVAYWWRTNEKRAFLNGELRRRALKMSIHSRRIAFWMQKKNSIELLMEA